MKDEVEKIIGELRPQLQADGGDIELVNIKDGVVFVKLLGSCAGCPLSQMTLKNGVERLLKAKIPGIKSVESI